ELLEDLGEHQPARWCDLPVLAVERRFSLGVAVHEAPGAADAKIDLADRYGVALAEAAPPLFHMFRLRHRFEHEMSRRIEQARHPDFLVRRCGDLEAVAIYRVIYDHDPSPPWLSPVAG